MLAGVVERRAEAAHAAVAERQRPVLDHELVRDQLLARHLAAGDDAGDRLGPVVAVADADADAVADAQPLAPPRVLDLELDRPHGDELARLPRPREVLQRVAAAPARVDLLDGAPLLVRRAAVHVEDPRPGRPLLVVAVAGGHRHRQPGEVDALGVTVLDQPREDAEALAVRRPAARRPVDPPAGADGVAVARLEVGPADPPAHPEPICIAGIRSFAGIVRPGTEAGAASTSTP